MPREREPTFLNQRTVASNPGQLKVQLRVFYRCFPRGAVVIAAGIPLLVGVAFAVNWLPLGLGSSAQAYLTFGPLILAVALTRHGRRVQEQFERGDLNPGIVLSHDPDLIAVAADLRIGWPPCPVLKILPHPLQRIPGGRPPLSSRVATIAVYRRGARRDRWADIRPVAVNCATTDPRQIEQALARIAPAEWEALAAALQQVPTPYRPGIYELQ